MAAATGGRGRRRTHFGRGDQEIGGLKPAAGSALANRVGAPSGRGVPKPGPTAPGQADTSAAGEHAWQAGQVGQAPASSWSGATA
jgi:hypothetical protein